MTSVLGLLALSALVGCAVDTPPDDTCVTDTRFFESRAAPVLADCAGCHTAGGTAATTRFLITGDTATDLEEIGTFVREEGGDALLLQKPTGQISHTGGERMDVLDSAYGVLDELVARLLAPGGCAHPGTPAATCDGTIRPGTAPLRRLTASQFSHAVDTLLGVEVDESLFPASTTGDGFGTFADYNTVSQAGAEQIQLAAEAAAAAVDVDALLACESGEDEATCARRFLLSFTEAAFRRPLTTSETTLATRFLDAGLDVDTAVRMQIELILQSPPFLYLDPVGVTPPPAVADSGAIQLDDHAVAARLAAFLADDLPDDTLRAAAAAGELRTREQVLAQALRLASAPEASRTVARFHRDWLHLWRSDGATRDATLYPTFSDAMLDAMAQELDLFTAEVVWSGDARFETLLLGTTTWVNPDLAAIYGVEAPSSGWARVTLDAERPGALTRAGFLTAHAYSAESAPVRRGAFVLEQMLCTDLTPPPGVNLTLPEESEETPTVRERLAAHAADPTCAACHDAIDPIGLSFEHFGAVGEWRDTWANGHPVDASGSLPEDMGDVAGDLEGAADLAALLATSERARSCYAQRWFEYAVGRPAETADACTLRTLSERFDASGGDIRQLVVDVTLTDAFLWRPEVE
jgi:cytochrome c553